MFDSQEEAETSKSTRQQPEPPLSNTYQNKHGRLPAASLFICSDICAEKAKKGGNKAESLVLDPGWTAEPTERPGAAWTSGKDVYLQVCLPRPV